MPRHLDSWMKMVLIESYRDEQRRYEEYWIKNIWGFNNRMRDYLLEGHRRMKMNW